MATIPIGALKIEGGPANLHGATIRWYTPTTGQTFVKNDLVKVTSGEVVIATVGAAVLGMAMENATHIVNGVSTLKTRVAVAVFETSTRIVANKVTTASAAATATTDVSTKFYIYKSAAGKWVARTNDPGGGVAMWGCVAHYQVDTVGDTGGRLIMQFDPAYLQFDFTATATTLTGLTASVAELNFNDTAVAGTAVASKTLVLGANKNVDTLVIADGGLYLGAGAGTAVTATAAELNLLASATISATELVQLDLSARGTPDGIVYTKLVSCGVGAGTGVNTAAGVTLVAAVSGKQFKLVDAKVIAVGGALAAAAAATGVGVYSDATGTPVLLFNALLAAATENTLVRMGDANTVILAAGASYDAQVANKAVTLKAVSAGALDLQGATSIDVLISYTLV